jgi:hypothetical protein
MAQAPRSFRRAAKKKVDRAVTAFTLDWVEDLTDEQEAEGVEPQVFRSDIFHATTPTDEQMFLTMALIGDEDNQAAQATAALDLFRSVLPSAEFHVLKERIANPEDSVDLDVVMEVLAWLMEVWSDFPTVPSSASSKSPTSIGEKSTGRVRGTGSTHSPSPSRVS